MIGRLKALCLLLIWTTLLAACSMQAPTNGANQAQTQTQDPAKKQGPYQIHFAVYSAGHPWIAAMVDHLKAHLEEDPNYKLTMSDGQLKKEKLIADIEDAISRKVHLILVNSSDADSPKEVVARAIAAGIPVLGVQKGVNTDKITGVVLGDEIDMGRQQAESIVKALEKRYGKPQGNLVILNGIPGSSNTVERNQGIKEVLSKYPEIKIISDQPTLFRRDKGREVMENVLQTGQKIDAVLALVDESAIGAAMAIKDKGVKDILIWGGNAQTEALQMIKDGSMHATLWIPDTVDQSVEVIKKVLKGEKIEQRILVKGELIDASTVGQVLNQKCYVYRGPVHKTHSKDGC
jgi:ABC-type sugar transport system substrate-binding protein